MIEKMIFNRLFSLTMYKNKTIPLGEMSFSKDFINDTRGNLYPVLKRSDNCIETLKDGKYTVDQGEVRRFICRFFPYASYRIEFTDLQGETGFEFDLKKTKASITYNGNLLSCKTENNKSSSKNTIDSFNKISMVFLFVSRSALFIPLF